MPRFHAALSGGAQRSSAAAERCHILCSTGPSFVPGFRLLPGTTLARRRRPLTGAAIPTAPARPPTRHKLSARAAERPEPCRERDPDLAAGRRANHRSPFNCVALGGRKRGFVCVCPSGMAARKYEHSFVLCFFFYIYRCASTFHTSLRDLSSVSSGDYFYFAKIAMEGFGSPQKCIAALPAEKNVKSE